MNEELKDYRNYLFQAEQKAQEDYDKTLLYLSSGALGISFAFVKDIVGPSPIVSSGWLITSWTLWGLSLAFVLVSFYLSVKALRNAVQQIDENTIYDQTAGGCFSFGVAAMNVLAGISFILGLGSMFVFVYVNIS